MSSEIGARLKDARRAAKLHQHDVAQEVGRSRQAISSWEAGKTLPTLLEFRQLLTFYGVSADQILFGEAVADTTQTALSRMRNEQPGFADTQI